MPDRWRTLIKVAQPVPEREERKEKTDTKSKEAHPVYKFERAEVLLRTLYNTGPAAFIAAVHSSGRQGRRRAFICDPPPGGYVHKVGTRARIYSSGRLLSAGIVDF